MTDDQGYGDIGLHKNPHLRTPTLDRFAREGVQFSRFYVSPVCAPTRASVMTGRYHYRTGVIHTSQGIAGEGMRLIDVFAPPRVDFSRQDGWVLNADEYPMPVA